MKKSLIAASASAVALAAMPIVGVFATPAPTPDIQEVDTINLTVSPGCHFTTTRTNTSISLTMEPGQYDSASTDALSISCNQAWKMTVVGTNLISTDAEDTAAVAAPIASTSGSVNGSISNYKLTLAPASPTGVTTNNFSTAKEVATTPGETAVVGSILSETVTLTPTYTVSVGHNQPTGSYSGTVTYTLGANN